MQPWQKSLTFTCRGTYCRTEALVSWIDRELAGFPDELRGAVVPLTATCHACEVTTDEGSPSELVPSEATGAAPSVVVIAIRTLRTSGAESLACHEAAQLVALGCEVGVWCQIDGPFRAELAKAGVKTVRVLLWSGRRRLRRLIRRAQDRLVVHTHSPSSGAFLRLVSLGINNVAFIHTEHNVSAAYRPVTRMLHRVMAWRIDDLVAVSAAALETAPPTRRSRVLHHMDLALPRMQACLALPPKVGAPLKLVCVASLTPKKDHANLLGALIILDRQLDGPLEVSLVGDGPLLEAITSQVAVLNRGCEHVTVKMLGHRDDIPSVLSDADVLVLPSLSEGMPLVLFEAMAASTPIVATDVGGVRDCCDSGGAGLLVPPADPAALAEGLGTLLSDATFRAQLAARAKAHLLAQEDTPWVNTYVRIIEQLTT